MEEQKVIPTVPQEDRERLPPGITPKLNKEKLKESIEQKQKAVDEKQIIQK